MSDLISREDVENTIQRLCDLCGEEERTNGVMCGACNLDNFIRVLDGIPSAESERKSGEWLEKEVFDNVDYEIPEWQSEKCSVCGKYHTTPYLYNFRTFEYCPNCGSYNGGQKNEK